MWNNHTFWKRNKATKTERGGGRLKKMEKKRGGGKLYTGGLHKIEGSGTFHQLYLI